MAVEVQEEMCNACFMSAIAQQRSAAVVECVLHACSCRARLPCSTHYSYCRPSAVVRFGQPPTSSPALVALPCNIEEAQTSTRINSLNCVDSGDESVKLLRFESI